MNKLGTVALVALGATVAAGPHGGWATVAIENAPDHLVAGEPNTLTVTIRQHGVRPLGGLTPVISARSGFSRVVGRVRETATEGTYHAVLEIPRAGDWTVSIESGFGSSRGRTLPWRAVKAPERPAPLAPYERGRQAFASRGCVTCHVHGAVDVAGQLNDAGPNLTDRRFAAEYLARFLADPTVKAPDPSRTMRMPNPELQPREIAALVAFLNDQRGQVVGVR